MPAHSGDERLVPPTIYQHGGPVHGVSAPEKLSKTQTPVEGLAAAATSGVPRMVTKPFWYSGAASKRLGPPPVFCQTFSFSKLPVMAFLLRVVPPTATTLGE